MFRYDRRWNELCDRQATQRHYYQVVAIPQGRNKVRYQVDGAQSVSSNTKRECLRIPGYARVSGCEVSRVRLPLYSTRLTKSFYTALWHTRTRCPADNISPMPSLLKPTVAGSPTAGRAGEPALLPLSVARMVSRCSGCRGCRTVERLK